MKQSIILLTQNPKTVNRYERQEKQKKEQNKQNKFRETG